MYLRQIAKKLVKIVEAIQRDKINEFRFDRKGVLRYDNRLCVLNDIELKRDIMREAHAR